MKPQNLMRLSKLQLVLTNKLTEEQQKALDTYVRSLGLPPEPPTQQGIYATPEFTGDSYPSEVIKPVDENQEPPEGWPRNPIFNAPGDVPGPPVQFGSPVEPETVKPAEGFTGIGLPENDIFYFHPDHLGSTSYITNKNGSISQHVEYIAFGEVLFEEHSSSFSSPYLFNGKELDRETNLSYYSARYYDTKVSLWLNVDPLAEKFYMNSPYIYVSQNPINLIDPTGMGEEGVYEPPVNGLAYFRDRTGEYFWNENKNAYAVHEPNADGTTSFSGKYYSANKFSEPVGKYSIIFDLSNTGEKDSYDPKKTIADIALPILMYLEAFGNVKDISNNNKYPGVKIYSSPDMNGAVTAGNMIIMNSAMVGDGETLDHEYGHYLDFKYHFNFNKNDYIDHIAIPSVKSAYKAKTNADHEKSVTEKRANRLGGAYSNNKKLKNKYRPTK